MKALVLKDYHHLVFEEVPTPKFSDDEVLVAVKACGICGSDVHGMDGSTGRRRPPLIMGHEAAGVIAEKGANVAGFKVGDRVTFDSTIYCGHCRYCRAGKINLCDNRRVLGVSCGDYKQDGAFAEYVAVPQRILYPLPESISFEHAALIEPFSIAFHAVRRLHPNLNDTVAVIGAGMIGIALVQALRASGCGRIIVVDVAEEKLALAKTLGATDSINSRDGKALDHLLALTNGVGVDAAFEAVGVAATVDLALRGVCKGGSVALVGNVAPDISFPLQTAVTRELTIYGSCASSGEYPACLDLMSRGVIHPEPLLSATAPLSEGALWFKKLYQKEPGLLKVILTVP
ncbi:MAG: galactitol-1-phosphate 5-dehydrogenase [Verrucomicrobiota bacterium]